MTTITLDLPESLVQRAGQAAEAVHRPLEEVIMAMLDGALPSLDDVPAHMRAELVEMTWLEDNALLAIAEAAMSGKDQQLLAELSERSTLAPREQEELETLRSRYGQLTLRKARAHALLSVRGGKRLLADAQAA